MTEKNAVPVKAKKAKKRSAPPSVAREEFAPPVNAAGFLVRRQVGEDSERLKFREEGGTVANVWPLAAVRPSRAWLLERWGSGSYRVVWLDAARRPCGTAPEATIDIPDRPARPAYPNPPAAVVAPDPAEVDADRMSVALKASGLASLAGPMLIVRELMGLVDGQAAERERRREREHELAIARVRAQAQEDVERLRAHYEGAAKVQAAPADAAAAKLVALEAEISRLKSLPALVEDDDDEDDDEDDGAKIAGYVAAFEKSQIGQAIMAWAASKMTEPTL